MLKNLDSPGIFQGLNYNIMSMKNTTQITVQLKYEISYLSMLHLLSSLENTDLNLMFDHISQKTTFTEGLINF
jgi:hypothetical protein